METSASRLQTLVDKPVFKHVEVTRRDADSLSIFFRRIFLINRRNIKRILFFGAVLPILVIILGVSVAIQGMDWGMAIACLAAFALCFSLLMIMAVGLLFWRQGRTSSVEAEKYELETPP